MRFIKYITEDAKYIDETEDLVNVVVPAIKKNTKLFRLPVIWRGWNTKKLFWFAEVTGGIKRDFMRGMSIMSFSTSSGQRDWMKDVVKALGFTPICATYDYHQAAFFGNPCIVIPDTDFEIYQNPNVTDIATMNPSHVDLGGGLRKTTYRYEDTEVEKIIAGYKEDYNNQNAELLIKCDKYYIINVRRMMIVASKSKFNKIKELKDIKTHQQLLDYIYVFRNYLSYIKKRKENDTER